MLDRCCQVGGTPSSLRAEAAALHLLLSHAPPDQRLTVLIDSLGLLQTLQRWGRLDFSPHPEVQKHFDVILPILHLLSRRTEPTTFVKVKSHSGIPLNDKADEMADQGSSNPEIAFPPILHGTSIALFTKDGAPIPNLLKHAKEAYNLTLCSQLRNKDGIMSRGFLQPERNQAMLARAKRHMTAKEKRRLLQCLGGVFPCNAWLHRIKMVPSPDCPICGLTDHFSHRVLSCIAVSEAITAAHNKAWSTLYNLLVSHLPQSWEHWYDKVVSTIDIPCASHSHLKPDAILRHKLSKSIYIASRLNRIEASHLINCWASWIV